MASWLDIISFIAMAALFVGTIVGVIYVANMVSGAVQSTKESLKSKGLDVSKSGMSVRTSGRFNREDYLDATQRGFIKSMGAASFGQHVSPNPSPAVRSGDDARPNGGGRKISSASVKTVDSTSSEEKKKRHLFGLRRTHSVAK